MWHQVARKRDKEGKEMFSTDQSPLSLTGSGMDATLRMAWPPALGQT